MSIDARRRSSSAALLLWITSRLACIGLVLLPGEQAVLSDVRTFRHWSYLLWHDDQTPASNGHREYPFGALAVLLPAPGSAENYVPFFVEFVALMLALDACIAALLWRFGRSGDRDGAWTWLLLLPLLGPVAYTRFDLLPAMFAVMASMTLLRRPALSGAAAVVGGCVKLWPLVVLPIAVMGRGGRRAVLGAAIASTAAFGLAASLGEATSVANAATNQSGRGVQVESFPAAVYLWWRVAGGPVNVVYQHGAWEAHGAGLDLLAGGLAVGGLIAAVIALALVRRRRTDSRLLAPAFVGIAICTDKVLSPQYAIWLLALSCVALLHWSAPRWVYGCLAMTMLLTHLVYPVSYTGLLEGRVAPLALLTLRDAALLALTVGLMRAATRGRGMR